MEFDNYQSEALKTDQFSDEKEKIMHSILNLTESVGVLHRIIEQRHRDKELPESYEHSRIEQKIGDILWYISNIASRTKVKLSDAAQNNLIKNQQRWGNVAEFSNKFFDEDHPVFEKLPRKLSVAFFSPNNSSNSKKIKKIMIAIPSENNEWVQIGDQIDDNAETEDGYRYHDVLHLAYVVHLGWSPVIRALLRRKRKSTPDKDRIDDGARAINLEEALTAFIFAHAKQMNFFAGASHVEFGLLKTIERLTLGLEVKNRSYADWEKSILEGYKVFNELKEKGEGLVVLDMSMENPSDRLKILDLPDSVKKHIKEL
jgi:NTP pyrophosphatase (non-canonical NTP hydrolase)